MSPIFLRSKKDGTNRMILNLKELNVFVKYEGRSFNCVTNGPPYRVAVRSTWKLR